MDSKDQFANDDIPYSALRKEIVDSLERVKKQIAQHTDPLTIETLHARFIVPSKQVLDGLDFLCSVQQNNRAKLDSAKQLMDSTSLMNDLAANGMTTATSKTLLLVRTFLATLTLKNIIASKMEIRWKAENIATLLRGLEDIPSELLAEWITNDKERRLKKELDGNLGSSIVGQIQRLFAIKAFKDGYLSANELKWLVERLAGAKKFDDIALFVIEYTDAIDITVKLCLPEQITCQFMFPDDYEGAESLIENRKIMIKIDIRYIIDRYRKTSDWWIENIGVLITRQMCHLILIVLERHGFPDMDHAYFVEKAAKRAIIGGISAFRRIKWEEVILAAGLEKSAF